MIEDRWGALPVDARPIPLVIEAQGCPPSSVEAVSALSRVVFQRTPDPSIMSTTTTDASEGELLGDTVVATASLDRRLHRSVPINLHGESDWM